MRRRNWKIICAKNVGRFQIIGKIEQVEIIAVGNSIRILPYLNKQFGKGRWRKLKGVATIERNSNGRIRLAEIHWYETHGIGKCN
ncbi:MAG: hypothetical protein ACR2F2_02910 [Pyrinomonadaceae bacterium]